MQKKPRSCSPSYFNLINDQNNFKNIYKSKLSTNTFNQIFKFFCVRTSLQTLTI